MPYLPQVPTEGTESNTVLQMMCLSKKVWCLLKSDGYRFIFIDIAREIWGKPPISRPKWSPTPLMLWFSISAVENSWCSKGTTWVPGSCKEQILHISVWSCQVWVHLNKKCGKNVSSLRPHKQCLWKCHHIYSTKPSKNRCCPAQAPPVGFPYPYGPGLSDWEHRV